MSDSEKEFKLHTLIVNIAWGFLAQGTALIVSVFMSFIVAKAINVTQYSYWQLYIFYLSYVCFFHFGLPDGIYLIFGGKKYEDLDYAMIGSQLRVMVIFHCIVSFFIITIGTVFLKNDFERFLVIVFTGIYLILMNVFNYLGMVLQAVNKTKLYSKGVIIDRVAFLSFIFVLLLLHTESFIPFAICYLIARTISMSYLMYKTPEIVFSSIKPLKETMIALIANIKVGISLTISVISGMLIIGIGRIMIDYQFGIETFGKLALTLSLANFFLNFLSQISMVLFPSLRTVSMDSLKSFYPFLQKVVSIVLTVSLLAYYPLKTFINMWLPAYSTSLIFLSYLMPLCLFDGKNQIICNTYMKVIRGERMLLVVNVIAMIISAALCGLSIFIFNNVYYALVGILIAIYIKYIIASCYIQQRMNISLKTEFLFEAILAVVFIISNLYLPTTKALAIYTIMLLMYACAEKNVIKYAVNEIKLRLVQR